MSVENVMNTIQAQESAESSGDESSISSGIEKTSSKTVRSIEDLFNATYEDTNPEEIDSAPLEKEEKPIPKDDKKQTANPKDEKKEEDVKEDIVEEKKEESPKEETQTFKVKVNGAEKEVPLQDLLSSYSGQQEIQRRFTEFDKQKKSWEREVSQEKEFTNFVKTEYSGLSEEINGLLSQYQKAGYVEKNPLNTINQLLDKMGINSNLFERALFEHQLPDYANYFNMSDVEREAFYTKKENDYLRKKEQGFTERDQLLKSQQEKQQKDFELIRSAGLDSVKYQELSSELENAGIKDITPERVVDYAKQKPLLDRIVNVFDKAGETAVNNEKAKIVHEILTKFPDTTDEEILEYLSPDSFALKTAKVLNEKGTKVPKVQPQKNEDAELNDMLNWFKR